MAFLSDSPSSRRLAFPMEEAAPARAAEAEAARPVSRRGVREELLSAAMQRLTPHNVALVSALATATWLLRRLFGGRCAQVPGGEPRSWSVRGVGSFLRAIGLAQHVKAFREAGVDGELLLTLSSEDYKELGVTRSVHLVRIANARGWRTCSSVAARAHAPSARPSAQKKLRLRLGLPLEEAYDSEEGGGQGSAMRRLVLPPLQRLRRPAIPRDEAATPAEDEGGAQEGPRDESAPPFAAARRAAEGARTREEEAFREAQAALDRERAATKARIREERAAAASAERVAIAGALADAKAQDAAALEAAQRRRSAAAFTALASMVAAQRVESETASAAASSAAEASEREARERERDAQAAWEQARAQEREEKRAREREAYAAELAAKAGAEEAARARRAAAQAQLMPGAPPPGGAAAMQKLADAKAQAARSLASFQLAYAGNGGEGEGEPHALPREPAQEQGSAPPSPEPGHSPPRRAAQAAPTPDARSRSASPAPSPAPSPRFNPTAVVDGGDAAAAAAAAGPARFALAAVGADTRLRLWAIPARAVPPSAAPLRISEGHSDEVKALAVLSDGRLLSGGRDTLLRLWSQDPRAPPLTIPGHTHTIFALAALPNAGCASGSGDMHVRIWRACAQDSPASGDSSTPSSLRCEHVLQGHKNMVFALAATADGARVLSGSADRTARLWSAVNSDAAAPRCTRVLAGHTGWVNCVSFVAHSPGRCATGSTDGSVRLWELATGECAVACSVAHQGAVLALTHLPSLRLLASAGDDGGLRLWRDDDGAEWGSKARAHDGPVRALAALPDGRLASAGDDRSVRLWKVAQGQVQAHGVLQGDETSDSVLALVAC